MSEPLPAGDHPPLPAAGAPPIRRVLVVANQTATSRALIAELRARAACGRVVFHLVVPALNSRLRHWVSDTDAAFEAAGRRCDEALTALESHGLTITGEIGDSVPLLAIEDALSRFAADQIVISTLPENRSHWLEHNLINRAGARFDVSVRHVIADEQVPPQPDQPSCETRPLAQRARRLISTQTLQRR